MEVIHLVAHLIAHLRSKLLKFVVLPNGLSSGKFTKLTKPPIAVLRLEGIIIAIYIDSFIILGETYEECLTRSIKTIKMFGGIFLPTQKRVHI